MLELSVLEHISCCTTAMDEIPTMLLTRCRYLHTDL